jgi:hypothetical protein
MSLPQIEEAKEDNSDVLFQGEFDENMNFTHHKFQF